MNQNFSEKFQKEDCFREAVTALAECDETQLMNNHPRSWFSDLENPALYQVFYFEHTKSLIVFNWDNTLVDAHYLRKAAIMAVIQHFNLTPPSADEVNCLAEKTLEQIVDGCVRHTKPPALSCAQVRRFLLDYYEIAEKLTLFPGVREGLLALKASGLQLALVTTQIKEVVCNELEYLSLNRLFDVVISSDDVPIGRPYHTALQQTMTHLNKSKHETVLIGSTKHTLEIAERMRVDSVGVNYRDTEAFIFMSTRYVAASCTELFNFLHEYCKTPNTLAEKEIPSHTHRAKL